MADRELKPIESFSLSVTPRGGRGDGYDVQWEIVTLTQQFEDIKSSGATFTTETLTYGLALRILAAALRITQAD